MIKAPNRLPELRKFLSENTRKDVPHPSMPEEKVRVVKVSRDKWTLKSSVGTFTMNFRLMSQRQVDTILGL